MYLIKYIHIAGLKPKPAKSQKKINDVFVFGNAKTVDKNIIVLGLDRIWSWAGDTTNSATKNIFQEGAKS